MNIIELKNVSKSFKDKKVLDNININIEEGSIIGIIGRNGSGKTVLLKIISKLYFFDEGEIKYQKYDIYKDYGILIDNGFIDNETGFNNLKTIGLLKNVVKNEDIYNILEFVKLNPLDKTKYKNYSMGMKQKLRLAQALMEKPKVLILDEPFNGLDKESVKYFREVILKLKSQGTTILLTSHYQEDIDKLCDNVYEMNDGKLSEL